ncbi:MAG: hypothetical protein NC429_12945 [Lachnospiraceae bacterium]|nr:hypothetical protein [Lachnospiraceae bacterium]
MPFVELKLCEKIGKILIEAKKLYHGETLTLLTAWLRSYVFSEMILGNEVFCSQAKTYVARCFVEEKFGILSQTEAAEIDNDVLYWFGYLVSYWCFAYQLEPGNIAENYDIEKIVNAYEALHSVSVKTAIRIITEEYVL